MAEELRVVITAKDGASRVFQEVGEAAQDAGTLAEKAGERGERGFKRMGDSAKNAKIDTAALGVAMTALGAGLSYAGNLAMQQERQMIALRSAYGDAASEMIRFAEELDSVTMFTDDDIRAGEMYFATLRNQYDMSIEQIQEVMRITADLASMRGISFEDASSRVTAALRGEAEAAEYLNLTMNQAAIDPLGLTLTMTNAEAAQFRLEALTEQAAVYNGVAADMADSDSGKIAEWKDRIEDLGASFGNIAGPAATFAAGLGSIGFGISQLIPTIGRLAGGAKVAQLGMAALSFATGPVGLGLAALAVAGGIATKMLGDNRAKAAEAKQAYDELQVSIATIDDTIRAANLRGDFGIAFKMDVMLTETTASIDALEQEYERIPDFWNTIADEMNAGSTSFVSEPFFREAIEFAYEQERISKEVMEGILSGNADTIRQNTGPIQEAMDAYYSAFVPNDDHKKLVVDEMQDMFELFNNPNIDEATVMAEFDRLFKKYISEAERPNFEGFKDAWNEYEAEVVASAEAIISSLDGLTESQRKFNWEMDDLRLDGFGQLAEDLTALNSMKLDPQTLGLDPKQVDATNASWERLFDSVEDGTVSMDVLGPKIHVLNELLRRGIITNQQHAAEIAYLANNVPMLAAETRAYTVDLIANENAALGLTGGLNALNEEQERQAQLLPALRAETRGWGQDVASIIPDLQEAAEHMRLLQETGNSLGAGWGDAAGPMVEDLLVLEETLQGILDLTGNGDFLSQWNMTSAASDASLLAGSLQDASASLDTIFRVVVGNTDAIANQVDGIHTWAEELINVEGEYGKIDDLLRDGLITQQQYNDAQLAYNDIAAANVQIQNDVLAIQAQQAPLIANQTTAMAEYVEQIRLMNDGTAEGAANQLEALAWMDQGLQEQAMNVAAFADQLDDLGANGTAAFTSMVDSIVATNPALAEMLVTMGYITDVVRDEDGRIISYSVDIDGGDGAMSEIERLTMSIDALTLALGGVPPLYIDASSADVATAAIDGVNQGLGALDGQSATVTMQGDSALALGAIDAVSSALIGLDGMSATVDIMANDLASAAISGIQGALNALDGRAVTSYVSTVYSSQGTPTRASGGVITPYASGGVVVELAEAGPEILHFASGGTAYVGQRGIYAVEPGTYVQPNNAIGNTNYGGVTVDFSGAVFHNTSREEMTRWAKDDFIPAIEQAVDTRNRQMGVK